MFFGGKTIKGVINLDMIGNAGSSECVKFGYKNYNGGNVISDLAVQMNSTFNIGLDTQSISSDVSASDHAPFWRNNIPAIYGHECVFSPVYHTTSDTTQHVNFSQITKATKITAATGMIRAFPDAHFFVRNATTPYNRRQFIMTRIKVSR